MKKISVMLIAMLIIGLVPAVAVAQEEMEGPGDGIERLIDRLKDRAEAAVEQRLETIERVREGLEEAEHLADEHERVLVEELDASASGLEELGRQIEAADTLEELRELIPRIFEDYRIYVVVVPKAKAVAVADTIGAAVDRLELVAVSLEDVIARLAAAGLDTSEAEAAVTAMKESLTEAGTFAGPVADTVLPLTPSDWPDPAQATLEGAQSDLRSARDAVESAVHSAREAGRILRDLLRL